MAGRPDWKFDPEKVSARLSIDGAASMTLEGNALLNLVLFPVKDGALRDSLRAARTLDWRLPWGDYHAEVAGLGAALDAVRRCNP